MRPLCSLTSSPCLPHRDRASIPTALRLAIPGTAQPDSCFLLSIERSVAHVEGTTGLRTRRLVQEQLLHRSGADRLHQYVVEAASEETLLLLQERVGGVGDHP